MARFGLKSTSGWAKKCFHFAVKWVLRMQKFCLILPKNIEFAVPPKSRRDDRILAGGATPANKKYNSFPKK